MSDDTNDRARIAANMAAVKEIPGAIEFCKSFQDAGLITGGSAILYVGPKREPEGRVISAADMYLPEKPKPVEATVGAPKKRKR